MQFPASIWPLNLKVTLTTLLPSPPLTQIEADIFLCDLSNSLRLLCATLWRSMLFSTLTNSGSMTQRCTASTFNRALVYVPYLATDQDKQTCFSGSGPLNHSSVFRPTHYFSLLEIEPSVPLPGGGIFQFRVTGLFHGVSRGMRLATGTHD